MDVQVISDAPERFASGSVVLRADTLQPLTVATSRRHGDRTIVSFEEIPDRTAAEGLRGTELLILASAARELEAGEFWDHDLIGCVVQTIDGAELGVVDDVLHQPAGELLSVRGEARTILVPLVRTVIKHVSPRDRITIEPTPGLLDNS